MTGQSVKRQTMIKFPSRKILKSELDVSDCNRQVLTGLDNWKNWSSKYVCIVGEKYSGKSTLGRYWADNAPAICISGTELSVSSIDEVSELATGHFVLDDADQCENEDNLLSLLNLLDENARGVLTLSAVSKDLNVDSKDLRSRLESIPLLTISAPDEAMLRLRLRTAGRRFFMRFSDSVLDYLVPRIPRDYSFLEKYVQELSDVVGDYRRPPTVPLVADVLAKMHTDD